MTDEIFLKWLRKFHKVVQRNHNEKVLLIFDGHGSHLSLEATEFAHQHNIDLYCFPSHLTHLLQPLDISTFNILKRKLTSAVRECAVNDGAFELSKHNIAWIIRTMASNMSPQNIICI
eukprot:TRINITY_DN9821_c0_g1_i2.p1 TRINITY_DN9821_c0_g1~~TRINITY_DN9821_c0_g1_i2.p1  ORF type:complete len:118 (+),score=11.18 TRINITY_DN9821_c0_g1_i2:216-569(+)